MNPVNNWTINGPPGKPMMDRQLMLAEWLNVIVKGMACIPKDTSTSKQIMTLPWKFTRLPSQHSVSGRWWPALFIGRGVLINLFLPHDVAYGSDITLCNKIDKLLVVYRFTRNVTTSIITLRKIRKTLDVFTPKMQFLSILMSLC